MKSYSIDFIVKWHEIDLHRRLRPFCFMNVAQELANVHASNLRFGYEELIAVDQVWVLSRFKARFLHYPKWQDRVSARTWHKGRQGIFGLRDFALYDQNGNDAIVATSSWVIINTRTRRIERNNIFNISEEAQSMALQQDAIGDRSRGTGIRTVPPCDVFRYRFQSPCEQRQVCGMGAGQLRHRVYKKLYAERIPDQLHYRSPVRGRSGYSEKGSPYSGVRTAGQQFGSRQHILLYRRPARGYGHIPGGFHFRQRRCKIIGEKQENDLPLSFRRAVLSPGKPGGKSGQDRAPHCGKRR